MSEVFHVFRPPMRHKDMPEGHRAVYYGQALGGRPCSNAVLHDPPRDGEDLRWIDEVLYCRLAPGATVDEFDERTNQAREAVEQ